MRPRARYVVAYALLLAPTLLGAQARADRSLPPDEDRFLNVPLPNTPIADARGDRTDLVSVAGGRPLLLALVFTRCAGVCPEFLASWRAADRWIANRGAIQRVVLSFDPRDSVADMAELAHHLGVADDAGWTFATAAPEAVRAVAATAGFWYDWDDARQQFDHPAMLAAVRNGRLIRLLVGGSVASGRLDELVREAVGELVPSYPLPGRVRFRCVQYDRRTGRAALDWGFAILFVPAGTIAVVTSIIFAAGARHRRRDGSVQTARLDSPGSR